jgi:hypothetical protein
MAAIGQIRVPLTLGRQGNDRSVRKSGDKSMRRPAKDQVSAVPGDKKDENLHPWGHAGVKLPAQAAG